VTPTEARRISLPQSIQFGELHEETYLTLGFQLVYIDPATALDRVEAIKRSLGCPRSP